MEKVRQELFGIRCAEIVDGYTDFIFIDNEGKVITYKQLNHRLDHICIDINRELHLYKDVDIESFPHIHNHMLRHTFATRMREAEADMKATSTIMGHEGIMITLKTYTDASREFVN